MGLTNILLLKKSATECQIKPFLRWISDEVENCIRIHKILIARVPKDLENIKEKWGYVDRKS